MDEKSVIYNNSKKLQGLFDMYSNSTENETGSQFRKCNQDLLSALHIDEFLNKIQSLKEKVEIRRENPSEDQQMTPGTVYVYDVHMVCGKNGLPIIEKGPEKGFFHNKQLPKAATVIWIHSKVVRVIDAKLCAYQEYRLDIDKERRILLHHAFDENDEIFKLSALHILDSLDDIISSIKSKTELPIPPSVLQNAAETVVTKENMRQLSKEADLYDGPNHVGTCDSTSYKCILPFTVHRIKVILFQKIFVQTVGLLVENVFHEVTNCLGKEGERVLERYFPYLKPDNRFANVYGSKAVMLVEPLEFFRLFEPITGFLTTIVNSIWPEDVNNYQWRNNVADKVFTYFWKFKSSFFSFVMNEALPDMLTRLRKDLEDVLNPSYDYKKKIKPSDQHALIDEWKARKSFEKSQIPSSIATYVSGRKYGVPTVKVFLNYEDTKAKEFVNEMWDTSIHTEFVMLTKKFKENSKSPLRKMELTASSVYVENVCRIIDRQGEKLMAYHSTIVAIGVDRNQNGFPCIVLYCLDKMLIPFGEEQIPEFLEDERVEIREF